MIIDKSPLKAGRKRIQMKLLSELKEYSDFEVLEKSSDGITQNGPDRCQPGSFVSEAFANGMVWTGGQVWVDKGLGVYSVRYYPQQEPGPEPELVEKQERVDYKDELGYFQPSVLKKFV